MKKIQGKVSIRHGIQTFIFTCALNEVIYNILSSHSLMFISFTHYK